MTDDIGALQEELKSDPGNQAAFGALAAHYQKVGDWRALYQLHAERTKEETSPAQWEPLCEKLEQISKDLADGREKAQLLVLLGDIYLDGAHNHDAGMLSYQRAYKAYPHDTSCLDRARAVYRRLGEFERVLVLYTLELKVKTEGRARAGVLMRMAQVKGDECNDINGALELIDEAMDLAPDDDFILQIAEIYADGDTVASRLERAIETARIANEEGDPILACELMVHAAQLEYDREGGRPERAIEYARLARTYDPDDVDATTVLVELCREQGRVEELLALQGGAEADISEGVSMLTPMRIGEIEEGPSRDSAVSEQEVAADEPDVGAAEDSPEGADANPVELEAVQEAPVEADAVEADAGELDFFDSVPAFDGDIEAARSALAQSAANLGALAMVRRELLDQGNVAALVEQLEKSVPALRKKDGELEVMSELAVLLWRQVGDMDRAEYFYKRIKLRDNEHPQMYAFYEDFYESQGEWRKLFAHLNTRRGEELGSVDEERDLAARLASLAEGELESPEKAIDVWKGFLRDHEGDELARRELRRLYEDSEKWNALVDFLKDELRLLEAQGEEAITDRVYILEEMAQIYRAHMNLDTMVINVLGQILELSPDHPTALYQLRELLESNRRFNDLASLLSDLADRAIERDETGTAVDLLIEVADIWQQSLNSVTQALPYLERVLTLVPEHDATRERLREIYTQRRDYNSLFDLELLEAQFLSGETQLAHLRGLVELANDRLREPERAAPVLARLLEIVPDDKEIIGQLEAIYARQEAWEGLAGVLSKKAALTDGQDQIEVLAKAAALYEEKLDLGEKAAEVWREILGLDAEHGAALARLTSILVQSERFDDLESLYRERKEVEALYDILDAAAASNASLETRRELYRRLADLGENDIEDADRVIISLENLRDLSEAPAPIARELIRWYQAVGELHREAEMNQVLLMAAQDAAGRFDCLVRLSELDTLQEKHKTALDWQLRAVRIKPDDRAALDKAEELAGAADGYDHFISQIEDIAELQEDDATQEDLWHRIGRVQWHTTGQIGAAVDHFERLRERHPTDLEFLEALEELYELDKAPEKRIEVLRTQIEVLTKNGAAPSDLVDQLSKIADVQRAHMGQPDAARDTYTQILDLDPDHLPALRGIKELYRKEESWDEVVNCLLRELGLLSGGEAEARADAQLELATIHREQLDDVSEALRYYGEILGELPEHEGALREVETLLSEPTLAREAALLVEPIFRERRQPEPLARALEARLKVCDDPYEEHEILDELIPIYRDDLDDTRVAFERACRQFELDADRDDVWLRLEELGANLNEWERIEESFARHSPLAGFEGAVRFDLLRHLAAIREHRLGLKQEALEAWERLYEYDPMDAAAIEALERLYRSMERYEDLVRVLKVRADLVDNDVDRVNFLLEAAQILDVMIEDVPATIEVYSAILLAEPEHEEAVTSLERLLRQESAWHDLDELLVRQGELAVDPDRRRGFLLRLGTLRFEELDDYAEAANVLQQLLAEDPGDDEAISAIVALDARIVESASMLELRLDIAQSLEPIYRMRADYPALIGVLRVRLEFTDTAFERVDLYDELARIHELELDDAKGAFEALRESVLLEPDNDERRERLEALATLHGSIKDAVDVFEEVVAQSDTLAAGPIMKRVAEIYEKRLEEPEAAIAAYEQSLAFNEADEDVLVALEGLYQSTSAYEKLATNLRRQVVFGDPDRRVELLRRVATIEEQVLERVVEATDAYIELLEAAPDDVAAMVALEGLYERQERWFDLAELLVRKAATVFEPDVQIETFQTLGDVYETKLSDVQEAIQAYQQILTLEPGHEYSLNALQRLFQAEARWSDLAEVLRAKLDALGQDEGQSSGQSHGLRDSLELRLADVQATELFEVQDALTLYRQVLARTPGKDEAIAALERLLADQAWSEEVAQDLEPHYIATQEWEKLTNLYDKLREQALDPLEQAGLLHKIARIRHAELEDHAGALEALSEAWKMDCENDVFRDELVSMAAGQEAWEQLAQAYREVLTVTGDPDRILDLHMRVALLQREQLDDIVEAEVHFREALNVDERHEQAYAAIEAIARDQERWHDLVEVLERKFVVLGGDDDELARDLLLQIAAIQRDLLEDGFSAVETYARVLNIYPQDTRAHVAITALFREQTRWQDLATHLEEQVERAIEIDDIRDLKTELAEVYSAHLTEPLRALDLYQEILDIENDHLATVGALEAMFESEEPFRADIAPLLEPVYRRAQNWTKVVEMLFARAEAEGDLHAQLPMLREAAELAGDTLGDHELALQTYGRVFRIDPADGGVRSAVHRHTLLTSSWIELIEIYDETLRENFGIADELRVELIVEQAQLLEERLHRLDDARQAYSEVLALDVDNHQAIDALERILMRSKDWTGLANLYDERIEASHDLGRRREWLERLAALHEEVLYDIDAAIAVHTRIAEIASDDRKTQQTLERLFTYARRWHDLADLFRQRAASATDPDQITSLRFGLAHLLESELDQIDEAIEMYREILDSEPAHFQTMRALEGLRRDLAIREGDWDHYRLQIIDLLLSQYDTRPHWRRINDLMEEKAKLVEDVGERVAVLAKLAHILSQVTDDPIELTHALLVLAKALCLDPSNEELQEQIEALATDLDAWERLLPVYLNGLANVDDPEAQSQILLRVAKVYEGPLEDIPSAIAAYQQAVDLSAENELALGKLQDLYAELQLWEPLVAILERQLESVFDSGARHRLLKRVATIYDEVLDKPAQAIRMYEELRAEEPAELSYIIVLERLFDRSGDDAGLEALLRNKVEMVDDPGVRLRTLKRLAQVQDERLHDSERAIGTYRTILTEDENDENAVRALARLLEESERWAELIQILEVEKDFADGVEALNEVHARMGRVLFEHLDSPQDAAGHFRAILERDPSHSQARQALLGLLEVDQTRAEAIQVLQSVYRASQEWPALEELYELAIAAAVDRERKAELFMELAQLHEEQLDNQQMAFMTLGRAFSELPEVTFISYEIERLSTALENFDELAAVYEDCIDAGIDDPSVLRDVRARLGQLYAEVIGDGAEAIRHFRGVLEIDDFDAEALSFLDRLYQAEQDWESLVEILERKLTIVEPAEMNAVCFQLGYLREVVFEMPAEALELYRRVILDEPHHGGAIEGLERLVEELDYREEIFGILEPTYLEMGSHAKLVQLYTLKLELAQHNAERADLQKKIARIEIEELGNVTVGYGFLGRALREDPHDLGVQEQLEGLAAQVGLYEELVILYEDIIAELGDPVRVIELALNAAVWAVNELADTTRASALFTMVLDLEGDNEIALTSLEQIARHENSYKDLATVLERKADLVFDPEVRFDVLVELGLVRTQLERYDAAVEAYRQALLLDESNVELMEALVGLFEVRERYADLVDINERLTRHLLEPADQLRLFMTIGRCSTLFLKEYDRALAAYQKAREIDPDNPDILSALEELYEASEQWNELRDVIARQLACAEDDAELVRLYVKNARISHEHFQNPTGAIEDYQRAFGMDGTNPVVVEALDSLYRQEGCWEDLLSLYGHLLTNAVDIDDARKVWLYVQMADISQAHLGDEDTAIHYLTTVLELDPHHGQALDVLGRLYTQRQDWDAVLNVMDRQYQAASDAPERVQVLLTRARLLETTLGQLDAAAETYLRVLDFEPMNQAVIDGLTELYGRMEAHTEVYVLLEHQANHAEDDDQRVEIYLKMGELARTKIPGGGLRIEALERAVALRSDDIAIAEPLLDAYIAANQFDQAEPLLAELITSLTEQRRMKDVVRFHHLQGKLNQQKGDADGALESFEAAHKIDATYIPNLLSLGKLIYAQQDWDKALKIFQTLLLHQMNIKDNADKVDVYFHLGHVRRHLGDDRRAKDMFNRALSIDPQHEATREALASL